MKQEKKEHHIDRPILAGVMAGYLATVINIIYDVIFRDSTSFPLHELINVSTIIFITLIILVVAGLIFAFFDRFFKQGNLVYIVVSAVFTIFCIVRVLNVQRTDNPGVNSQFQHLLLGLVIVTGAACTFLLPYLIAHDKIYMERE